MAARWTSFGVGLWLALAPLVLGYGSVAPILHGVAVGLLVCILTLAALEWPPLRFALAGPALWLVATAHLSSDAAASAVELGSGVLLGAATLVPSARLVPRPRPGSRAGDAGARA
jgi:hypothetical protein